MGVDGRPASSAWTRSFWARTAALIVVAAAFGLPINALWVYGLLLIAAVLVLSGEVTLAPRRWAAAVVCILIAAVLPRFIAPAPITEGENLFLSGKPGNAIERGLPPDVY